ncbi:hexosaminidase D-like, partial [Saccoglossus kowalevskii]|uniref:beta-N-acetylhexosaminidase n=1 Tax=Saccoglossus kowalevskii TaxID=10224 RepID=A0ABM0MV23_SACKO
LEDIMMLQKIAKENNMEYIPLIQTFGHFEFVLKHEKFADLREVPQYSQSLCPSRQNSLEIIHLMIDQIMSTHPASKYLHIGADEVYALGKCNICTGRLETEFSGDLQSLFLSHVTAVSRYIKKKYPATVVIMWDDMLRNINTTKGEGCQKELQTMVRIAANQTESKTNRESVASQRSLPTKSDRITNKKRLGVAN